jgi:tetratricopeptide (TPR) repeat protein
MLGELMLLRGFGAEARQHFIEYAQRMAKSGKVVEAFKALKRFADASHASQEVRGMLTEQLEAAIKEDPQNAGLKRLYEEFTGRASTAVSVEVPEPEAAPDLIFIDLDREPGDDTGESAVETGSLEIDATAVSGDEAAVESGGSTGMEVLGVAELAEVEEDEVPDITPLHAGDLSEDVVGIDLDEVPVLETIGSDDETAGQMDDVGSLVDDTPPAAGEESAAVGPAEDVVFVTNDPVVAADETSSVADPPSSVDDEPSSAADLDVPDLDLGGFGESGAVLGRPDAQQEESDAHEAGGEEGKDNLDEYLRGTGGYVLDDLTDAEDQVVEKFAAFPEVEVTDVPELPGAPERTVESLEALVAQSPDDAAVRREFAELLLEEGERDRGLDELDTALEAFEEAEDWDDATSVANEILLLEPNSVPHLQKCVEFAYRRGDQSQLVPAYVDLANGLFRSGAMEECRTVFERVLELDPENEDAKEGIATVAQFVPAPPDSARPAEEPTAAPAPAVAPAPAPAPVPATRRSSGFVDLGALILGDDEEKSARMIGKEERSGDEQRDFEVMLSQFKKGIEENIDEADAEAHYDLGVAFKEMGLLDEGIAEFQKALRSDDTRLQAAEALGLCFYEKGQLQVAATVMRRAVDTDPSGDDAKIGLLYWLGRCDEEQSRAEGALAYYERVFALDIKFQDVSQRVSALSKAQG